MGNCRHLGNKAIMMVTEERGEAAGTPLIPDASFPLSLFTPIPTSKLGGWGEPPYGAEGGRERKEKRVPEIIQQDYYVVRSTYTHRERSEWENVYIFVAQEEHS